MHPDRPTAFLLCGPSLSGKTTAAATIAAACRAKTISADAINDERGLPFGGQGLPESAWAETLRIEIDRLHAFARAGMNIVVDDTLCYRWLRDAFRRECAAAGVDAILLVFAAAEDEILRRRTAAAHSGVRPVLGLQRLREHLRAFEWPGADEQATVIRSAADLAALIGSCHGGSGR